MAENEKGRKSVLSRINLVLVLLVGLLLIIGSIFTYISIKIRAQSEPIIKSELPNALAINSMISSLRLMNGNASEYLLREPEEAVEYQKNRHDLLSAYEQIERNIQENRGSVGASDLLRLRELLDVLDVQYRKRIFEAYDPELEQRAASIATAIVADVAEPLEARLDALAASELQDAGTGTVEEILTDDLPGVRYYLQLVDEAGDMLSALNRYLLNDPTSRKNFFADALQFEKWLIELKPLETMEAEKAELREIERLYRELRTKGGQLFELYDPSSYNRAVAAFDEIEHRYFISTEALLLGLGSGYTENVKSSLGSLSEEVSLLLKLVLICVVVGVALTIAVIRFVRISVYQPIVALSDAVTRLKQGERKIAFQASNDEMGEVFARLNELQDELTDVDYLREKEITYQKELETERDRLSSTLQNLKAAQEELAEKERLASLGSLVAGVAHEINTPLGVAVTVGTTVETQVDEFLAQLKTGELELSALQEFEHDSKESMRVMLAALNRASALIFNFKQIAIDQSSQQRREFPLCGLLREIFETLDHQIRKTNFTYRIECDVELEMDSYPGPLGQVFTNLFNNSILHGFDGRDYGDIAIKVVSKSADNVNIYFSDNGVGVRDDDISKVFDPFFTTKNGRGGSGLGLNIVYNIITVILGGSISIESKIGTTLVITLPVSAPKQ